MIDDEFIQNFVDKVTEEFTEGDWESISRDNLVYHATEFFEENPHLKDDICTARYKFELYMGW